MKGRNSNSIKEINFSDFPVVGKAFLSFSIVVGKVRSLLLSTFAMPTKIDFGKELTHTLVLVCNEDLSKSKLNINQALLALIIHCAAINIIPII